MRFVLSGNLLRFADFRRDIPITGETLGEGLDRWVVDGGDVESGCVFRAINKGRHVRRRPDGQHHLVRRPGLRGRDRRTPTRPPMICEGLARNYAGLRAGT